MIKYYLVYNSLNILNNEMIDVFGEIEWDFIMLVEFYNLEVIMGFCFV